MKTSAIRHLSFYPFVQPLARDKALFRLDAAYRDLSAAELIWWKRTEPENRHAIPMVIRYEDQNTTQWTSCADFSEEAHYIKYAFKLNDTDGKTWWLNSLGIQDVFTLEGSYEILQINDTDIISVPDWAKGCIYYQIFPERFARGTEIRKDLADWDSVPTRDNYMGGTLPGICDKISYLRDLGVECIYLNPIFLADFNHKYATTDYFQIDPLFGTEQDLISLVDIAHRNGIKIILDGVFNHVGIHFAPFEDLVRNGEDSQYREWFYPKRFPIENTPECYECVGDYPYMPRLNGANSDVRKYVRDVLLYWLDHAHIDGWRFDVADELDRHAVTWWREEVKKKYPDAVLLCETWGDASNMLGPDGFDCAMNYLFRDAMIDYFAHGSITESIFSNRLMNMLMRYPDQMNMAMYNCLGSHDTARFLTECGNEEWRLKQAMAFQMLFLGSPAIYYGDELGMTGENDPGCRGGMIWEHPDQNLLTWEKELVQVRKEHESIRKGSYEPLIADDQAHLFAFKRSLGSDYVIAVFNSGETSHHLDFTEAEESVDVQPHSVKIITKS